MPFPVSIITTMTPIERQVRPTHLSVPFLFSFSFPVFQKKWLRITTMIGTISRITDGILPLIV